MSFSTRGFLRLAAIGAILAALGLSACGRKGPLDPPPSAVNDPDLTTTTRVGPGGLPVPRGQDKSIPLDVLLD